MFLVTRSVRPLVCSLTLLLTLSFASAAFADAESNSKARALYNDGVAHQQAGRHEQACDAFSKAFSLRRHYQIAANLGDCELKLKRYRVAAEHLHFAVVEISKDPDVEPSQAEPITKLLRKAQAELITISLQVSLFGKQRADYALLVDNKPTKINGDIAFADPGSHKLVASIAGAESPPTTIDGPKGSKRSAKLNLRPAATTPVASATGASNGPRAGWPAAVFLSVGLAATVGVAITTPLMLMNDGEVTDLADQIQSATKQSPHMYCAVVVQTYQQQCTDWRAARSARTDAKAAMVGTALVAGLGLAAAAIWHWAPSSEPTQTGAIELGFGASATPRGGNLQLRGSFQ